MSLYGRNFQLNYRNMMYAIRKILFSEKTRALVLSMAQNRNILLALSRVVC
jgi:hypothetical protein